MKNKPKYDRMKQSVMMSDAGLLHCTGPSLVQCLTKCTLNGQLTRVRPTLISSVFRITLKLAALGKFILKSSSCPQKSESKKDML